jgi:hypothetical protein
MIDGSPPTIRPKILRISGLAKKIAVCSALSPNLSTGQKIEGLEKPVDMEFQIEKGFGQEI